MKNKDIICDVINGYFMDVSNDVIKVKGDEAMIEDLSVKICKALKIEEENECGRI
ncbi:unnamed protein product [marine sediment metagenome]|uniref:Uncharacterized protein n=1 Tax=marine sediment metagenome TaxID=412755 RepID=X1IHK5_9ZZZZ